MCLPSGCDKEEQDTCIHREFISLKIYTHRPGDNVVTIIASYQRKRGPNLTFLISQPFLTDFWSVSTLYVWSMSTSCACYVLFMVTIYMEFYTFPLHCHNWYLSCFQIFANINMLKSTAQSSYLLRSKITESKRKNCFFKHSWSSLQNI